jgi:hypothetical protein
VNASTQAIVTRDKVVCGDVRQMAKKKKKKKKKKKSFFLRFLFWAALETAMGELKTTQSPNQTTRVEKNNRVTNPVFSILDEKNEKKVFGSENLTRVSKRALGFDERKHKTNRILGDVLAVDWELDTPTRQKNQRNKPKKKAKEAKLTKTLRKKSWQKDAYYQTYVTYHYS